jgi:LPXTG-motif cell wall-anchored protein
VENTTVLNDLFNRPLLSSKNYSYTVGLRTDSRGIKVALAYQRDKVKVLNTFSYQCYIRTSTLVTLSDRNATFNCNNTTDPSNPIGSTGLYARAPLVVEAEIRPEGEGGPVLPVVFISNHFKAKSGTQIPEDPEYDLRRANEGRELAKLVDSLVAGGKANVIVMGDLNDYESSPALQELTSGKSALRNLTLEVPEQGRYSYIYNFVAQVLDHILVTPSLMQYFESARFALFDADTPYYLDIGGKRADDETSFAGSVSDHNPPLAIFNLRPGGLPELGVGGGAPKDEVNWQLWAIIGLSLLLVGAGALLALRRRKQ